MYNRYVPQSDGSYKRNRMQDCPPPQRTPPQAPPCPPPEAPTVAPPCPPSQKPCHPEPRHKPSMEHKGSSVGSFLRKLLPADFDTGDLIVVLLLLLMAGDKPEDKNTALLTLALYCFL